MEADMELSHGVGVKVGDADVRVVIVDEVRRQGERVGGRFHEAVS